MDVDRMLGAIGEIYEGSTLFDDVRSRLRFIQLATQALQQNPNAFDKQTDRALFIDEHANEAWGDMRPLLKDLDGVGSVDVFMLRETERQQYQSYTTIDYFLNLRDVRAAYLEGMGILTTEIKEYNPCDSEERRVEGLHAFQTHPKPSGWFSNGKKKRIIAALSSITKYDLSDEVREISCQIERLYRNSGRMFAERGRY